PTNPTTDFTVPSICTADEALELTLTAYTERNLFASDSMLVYVCDDSGVRFCRNLPELPGISIVDDEGGSVECPAPCEQPNRAPYADAGEDEVMVEGTTRVLTCEGGDPDGDAVTYYWEAASGYFADPTVLHPTYTAPMLEPGEAQYDILTFTVSDAGGKSSSDTLLVTIRKNNMAPIAYAGRDISAVEGSTIQLACDGTDPDGDPVTFQWRASSGRFDDPSALHPFYYVPLLDCEEERTVVLTLIVTDNFGNVGEDTLSITVQNSELLPGRGAFYRRVVSEGEAIHLTGSATDADGDALSILWMASSGEFDRPDDLNTTYTAPILFQGEECRLVDVQFRVTDICGNTSLDSQQIIVYPAAYMAPVVDAGPPTLATSTRMLTLDTAYAHDPKGSQVRLLWGIARGCGSILGETTVNPTIVFCPDSSSGDEILLVLYAIDGYGNSANDYVLVTLLED
ncbi:hypothetical protein ACFLSG_04810, partial [Candidatus Bipolaricaulota bacterium]